MSRLLFPILMSVGDDETRVSIKIEKSENGRQIAHLMSAPFDVANPVEESKRALLLACWEIESFVRGGR